MIDNVLSCIAMYQERRLAMWKFLIDDGWMDPGEAGIFDEWWGMNPPKYEASYYGSRPVRNYRGGLRITNGHRQFVLDSVREHAVMRSIAEGLTISLVELVRSCQEIFEHAEEIKALQRKAEMHFAMFNHGALSEAEGTIHSNSRIGADGQLCHEHSSSPADAFTPLTSGRMGKWSKPIRPTLPSYYFDPPHLECARREFVAGNKAGAEALSISR